MKKGDDEELLTKLEEYARLKIELDRRTGSLSVTQFLMMIVAFVLLVFFGGFLGEIILGSPFGIIFASVLAALIVKGMSEGIKENNIRRFLEDRKESREDELAKGDNQTLTPDSDVNLPDPDEAQISEWRARIQIVDSEMRVYKWSREWGLREVPQRTYRLRS